MDSYHHVFSVIKNWDVFATHYRISLIINADYFRKRKTVTKYNKRLQAIFGTL